MEKLNKDFVKKLNKKIQEQEEQKEVLHKLPSFYRISPIRIWKSISDERIFFTIWGISLIVFIISFIITFF